MRLSCLGWSLAVGLGAVAAIGCSNAAPVSDSDSGASLPPGTLTYATDVQPLLAAHCKACHTVGGIAPFPLDTYAEVVAEKSLIADDVQAKIMPPWAPDDSCNGYQADRSLSAAQITTLVTWANGDAPEGDPTITPTPAVPPTGLSRVDLTLAMPAPYTPTLSPDDYHCFMIDWPETSTKYVTGLSLTPGNPKIVHHAIAYIAPPDQLASYDQQLQTLSDGGLIPNYTCFGGPGGMGALTGWLGVWTPGSSYGDLPAGTGVLIQPGSKIILQVHYNVTNGPGESDLSSIQLKVDDQVDKPAALVPFTNPLWVIDPPTMDIPANTADVEHSFSYDPTPNMAQLTNGAIASNQPFTVYSAGAHMHLRGTTQSLQIVHADGGANTCLIDVPAWNFRWQGNYFLQNPVVVNPGDQVALDCHWNNSAAAQPIVSGVQTPSADITWGEDTEDEMCLGMFYVTN